MRSKYKTMADLAKAAQVSLKTISRVVNGEKGVGPETRARIEGLIKAESFKANDAARNLSVQRIRNSHKTIGFLCHTTIVHYYFTELQSGIMIEARRQGYRVMLEQVGQLTDGAVLRGRLRDMKIDGAILHPRIANDVSVLDALDDLKIPYVRVSPIDEGLRSSYVCIDEFQAAYDITDHIIGKGHVDIGFIKLGLPGVETGERERGYREALQARGIISRPDRILSCGWNLSDFIPELESYLTMADRPSAIFAASDKIAFCALGLATKLKIRVPESLSIAGFDDNPGWESTWPPLTTVHHPIAKLGEAALRHLLQNVEGKDRGTPSAIRLPHHLVIRQSVGEC